jgi:hypothetical protein
MAFENLHHLMADIHRFQRRRNYFHHYLPLFEQVHQLSPMGFRLFFSFLR